MSFLLLQIGDDLLLQNGDKLLLQADGGGGFVDNTTPILMHVLGAAPC